MSVVEATKYSEVELGGADGEGQNGHANGESPGMARTPSKVKRQDVKWSDVNFRVKDKVILQDCWGHVPNGKLLAIMGPSGAGKSSLLNVLAGRSSSSASAGIEVKVMYTRIYAYVCKHLAATHSAYGYCRARSRSAGTPSTRCSSGRTSPM